MKEFEVNRHLAAEVGTIWELLDDSATWPSWTPLDAHQPVSPRGPDGLGEVRLFRNGRYNVREQIIERRPETHLAYTVLSGLGVRDYRAAIDLQPVPGSGTDLRWHTTFRPKVVGTGWLYARALRSATDAFVDGLAARLEGEHHPAGASE